MPTPKLTNEIISAAIQGFEGQKRQIDEQIAELKAMLSGVPAETAIMLEEGAPRKRKTFSAATRRRMAEAQRLRYSKQKVQTESVSPEPATPEAPKVKRQLSAAGRKAISEATKKRWALRKAAKPAKSAPAKKAASKTAKVKKTTAKARKAAPLKRTAKKTSPLAAEPVV